MQEGGAEGGRGGEVEEGSGEGVGGAVEGVHCNFMEYDERFPRG